MCEMRYSVQNILTSFLKDEVMIFRGSAGAAHLCMYHHHSSMTIKVNQPIDIHYLNN